MRRRHGDSEDHIIVVKANVANSYQSLGRTEALDMYRDVYFGWLKLNGEEHQSTLMAANNYAGMLKILKRFEEAKALMRKTSAAARRALGETHSIRLSLTCNYAVALYDDPAATLDDLKEAVRTLTDAARIAHRVLGGAHPTALTIADSLRRALALLRARTE
jgi:hypothetical protein